MSRRGSLHAVLCSLSLFACATDAGRQPTPGLLITGLEIHNHTQAYVSATRLMVPATGRFVSCGNLGPGARCATGFPEVAYTGNPVELTWSQSGQIHSTGLLEMTPSEAVLESGVARVRVLILGPGSAGVGLVPDENGGE